MINSLALLQYCSIVPNGPMRGRQHLGTWKPREKKQRKESPFPYHRERFVPEWHEYVARKQHEYVELDSDSVLKIIAWGKNPQTWI